MAHQLSRLSPTMLFHIILSFILSILTNGTPNANLVNTVYQDSSVDINSPITFEDISGYLSEVLDSPYEFELIANGIPFTEGAIWIENYLYFDNGYLLFTDIGDSFNTYSDDYGCLWRYWRSKDINSATIEENIECMYNFGSNAAPSGVAWTETKEFKNDL